MWLKLKTFVHIRYVNPCTNLTISSDCIFGKGMFIRKGKHFDVLFSETIYIYTVVFKLQTFCLSFRSWAAPPKHYFGRRQDFLIELGFIKVFKWPCICLNAQRNAYITQSGRDSLQLLLWYLIQWEYISYITTFALKFTSVEQFSILHHVGEYTHQVHPFISVFVESFPTNRLCTIWLLRTVTTSVMLF